ncbi:MULTISPECIES: hypothetical protein [unclassified Mycolicibacterium]|nr:MULTISPECIES: hypothetical protein [unclassified Mycolicibacterium]
MTPTDGLHATKTMQAAAGAGSSVPTNGGSAGPKIGLRWHGATSDHVRR